MLGGIILLPCCLQKLHEYDRGRTAFVKLKPPSSTRTSESDNNSTNDSELLLYNYFRWANYLKERVSGQQVSGGSGNDDADVVVVMMMMILLTM